MYYVAVDIGCIECGEDSAVLGVFSAKEKADAVCLEHADRQAKHWCGEHHFQVFEIEKMDCVQRREYVGGLNQKERPVPTMKKEKETKEQKRDITDGSPLWAWFFPCGLSLVAIVISVVKIFI